MGCKWKAPTTAAPQGPGPSQQAEAKAQNRPHGDAYDPSKRGAWRAAHVHMGAAQIGGPTPPAPWLSQGLSAQSRLAAPSVATPQHPSLYSVGASSDTRKQGRILVLGAGG